MLEILLVDDEPSIRLTVGDALRDAGHAVTEAADGEAALRLIGDQAFDLIVSDIRLPHHDGLTIFREVRSTAPETDFILITAYGEVSDAVAAMKSGARDYLTKPFDTDELLVRLEHLEEERRMRSELARARTELANRSPDSLLVGHSPPMTSLLERIKTIGQSDAAVLVTGESGTGKELVARTLHAQSTRADKPFVPVHCAAFPETLIEAELFGHERGAFTGAVRKREGRFRAADGGTLFLDEVAEIPLPTQAKLLRVVQEGSFEPLGTSTPVQVDVRLICATHRDLKQRIAEGLFREDLFYRIHVLDVDIPPLRERMGDLPILCQHFLDRLTRGRQPVPTLSPRAWAALTEYEFPGNVRELEHALEHAFVLSRGEEIDLPHLPTTIAGAAQPAGDSDGAFKPLSVVSKEFEREYLIRALRRAGGKRTLAAEMLGISRKNLWEKVRDHKIREEEFAS